MKQTRDEVAERGRKRGRGLTGKLALALLAAVGTLVALEAAARLFFPPIPANLLPGLSPGEIEDPQLLWRNRPGYPDRGTEGPINAHGWRGVETPIAPEEGTFRILSVGESTTYGHGVRWDATYSHGLELILRRQGRDVEVVNAGVRAWSTYQVLRYLEIHIGEIRPDLVLVYNEINDFLPTTFRGVDLPGAGLTDSELIAISSRRAPIRAWLRRSRLVTGIQLWRARRQMSRETLERAGVLDRDVLQTASLPYDALPFGGGEPQWMANPEPFVRVPDDERERSLERLVELTRNAGVQLVLAHPAYPVSRPHRCVLTRVATEAGVPVIEIEELLASAAATNGRRREDYFVAGDTFHPNARGQRRIAEGLAGLLVEQGLLPPAEGPGGGTDDPMRRNAQ